MKPATVLKILVVEDEYLIRHMATDALTKAGYHVLEAATGEEAMDQCLQAAPDVLFTDIRLPGQINGWDIAEDCRDSNPGIPVIYATAHSHVDPRPVPGSVWLQKPYQPHQVVDVVRTLTQQPSRRA
jgi:CheY-like chemotaxis protein